MGLQRFENVEGLIVENNGLSLPFSLHAELTAVEDDCVSILVFNPFSYESVSPYVARRWIP